MALDIFLGAIETKTSGRQFMSQSCNPCGVWNGFGLVVQVVDLSNSRQTDANPTPPLAWHFRSGVYSASIGPISRHIGGAMNRVRR